MAQHSIKGSFQLAKAIKTRRNELKLTIEEAAARAEVGTKTWCRYEAGESIRQDKCRGVCKALNWLELPDSMGQLELNTIEYYKKSEVWSKYIEEYFGESAAISFVVGSDILLDHIREDLQKLSELPRGSHIGQLKTSFLSYNLPEQFLTRYDYEFLYALRHVVMHFRKLAHDNSEIIAHSVLEELALYLIVEEADFLMESLGCAEDGWNEWIFDIFDDMDIVTLLYSDLFYLTEDWNYHFDYWMDEQFWKNDDDTE